MSLLKEIPDKGATVAWSTASAYPNIIAVGSKEGGGVGFDNYGGELELYRVDFENNNPSPVNAGSVKTTARFSSLAWSKMSKQSAKFPCGIIAGGMSDGTVNIWDPLKLMRNEGAQSQLARVQRHKGAVKGLQFNPHRDSSHLLGSGGADNEVYIMALERPDAPTIFSPGEAVKHNAEVSCVAWNTQVAHILATGASNGICMIWDLKQKRPWCSLTDPHRAPVSSVAWNPTEAQHIITASEDDQKPVIRLWDLRSSTSTPLAELNGHTAGILSISWCHYDTGLLLSCGKDNRTLLWDLFSGKSIFELPSTGTMEQPQAPGGFFGAAGGGQRRYDVQWAPHIPAVISTCSFDRKVQVFGMAGAGSKTSTRAPKWLRRPCGVSWGFGGKLVSFSSGPAGNSMGMPNPQAMSKMVQIRQVITEPEVVDGAVKFEETLNSKDFKAFCKDKAASAKTEHDKNVWSFMQILFEKDARQQLLLQLGFDAEVVTKEAAKYSQKPKTPGDAAATSTPASETGSATGSETRSMAEAFAPSNGPSGADIFNAPAAGVEEVPGMTELSLEGVDSKPGDGEADQKLASDDKKEDAPIAKAIEALSSLAPSLGPRSPVQGGPVPTYTKESEDMIKRALLVGNFEAAVDCCLFHNQLADALLLATCGGPELWARTQEAYFARQQRPFLKLVSAIIKSELGQLVASSDLNKWKETLAILSTYGKSEEFPSLCEALANRLESERKDIRSAMLCYMCAVNVKKTVAVWVKEAARSATVIGSTAALQDLVEKVSIFRQALLDQGDQDLGGEVARHFANYAALLASQGRVDLATKYAIFQDESCTLLRDRLEQAQQTSAASAGGWGQTAAKPQQAAPTSYGTQQPRAGYGAAAAPSPVPSAAAPAYGAASGGYGAPATGAVGGYGASATGAATGYGAYGVPSAAASAATYGQPAAVPQPVAATGYGGQAGGGYGTGAPTSQYGAGSSYGTGASYPQTSAYAAPTPVPTPAAPYGAAPAAAAGGSFGVSTASTPAPPSSYSMGGASGGYGGQGFGASAYGSAPVPTPPVPSSTPLDAARAATLAGRAPSSVPDIREAKKDGFVSSVGNKDLAKKYGNQVSLSPRPATETSAVAEVPAPPPPPPGDVSNVARESMPIVEAFRGLIDLLANIDLSAPERKQLQEIEKSRDALFSKLNSNAVSPDVLAKLLEMAQLFAVRDYRGAHNINTALTTSAWDQNKDWLKGTKFLIQLAQKKNV